MPLTLANATAVRSLGERALSTAQASVWQPALALVMDDRAPNILLIPGTSSVAHLRENIKVTELKLSPDVLRSLRRIGAAKA